MLTERKPDSLDAASSARRTSDGEDPVLAHWNFEMGKMAVFTSGWWTSGERTGSAGSKFGKFWAQVVRWAMRRPATAGSSTSSPALDGNRGKVVIEALNKDASYLNFLQIRRPARCTPSGTRSRST